MRLRQLEKKDAPFMLEWLTDKNINRFFRFDSTGMTLEDAERYIEKSQHTDENRHYAIVDDNDEYLGTISLKEINHTDKNAEYAISMRACAQGTGASGFATREIFKIAFNELKLHKVYLNVLADNTRAIRFYEKMGIGYEGEFKQHVFVKGKLCDLKWFAVFNDGQEDQL